MSPPGDRREPPAGMKCPPAAQRKQAKRAYSDKKGHMWHKVAVIDI